MNLFPLQSNPKYNNHILSVLRSRLLHVTNSNMSSKTALVLRATGSQGKAVVKHLAKSGWKVHALVSDPSADRALALQEFGNVTLHKGTLGDHASIKAAIAGTDAVFLTQMPSFTGTSPCEAIRRSRSHFASSEHLLNFLSRYQQPKCMLILHLQIKTIPKSKMPKP